MLSFITICLFAALAAAQKWCTGDIGSVAEQTPCFFPFNYRGSMHYGCIDDGLGELWCSTTYHYDMDAEWGVCTKCTAPKSCTGNIGNVSPATACVFPFVYRGETYHNCTRDDWTTPWCSTTTYYDIEQNWGECASCPSAVTASRCIYGNSGHDNGTQLCVNGTKHICVDGQWEDTELMCGAHRKFVDCSHFGHVCSTAFSTTLNEFLVFCGQSGNISSAVSLCYPGNGEHTCSTGKTIANQNWIVRAGDSTHRGIKCPSR